MVLGWFWDGFGMILGWFGDDFGMILGWFRDVFSVFRSSSGQNFQNIGDF